jgi:CBS domain containing-hemolysin-like protein
LLSQIVGNLIIIMLLVLANAFFVAAEFAIVKVRSSQITQKVKSGHRRAALAKTVVEHLDSYLSATQLGITLASLGLGWVGEPLLADMIRDPLSDLGIVGEKTVHALAFGISFGLLTFLHIIIGELAPKSLAIRHPERTTLVISAPLQIFYRIFQPVIWLLNGAANLLLKSIGIPAASATELVHSPEEVEIIVNEGAKRGFFNKTEQELISSIFEFSTTRAKEIMVPRTDIVAIDVSTKRDALVSVVMEEGYSRIPVYSGSIDNIVGIIYTKDLISLLEHRDLIVLQDIIRSAYFVPDQIRISQLMKELQERKIHMAIVVDEFGGTEGIITMEDILEEIVGEIHDEYDEVMKDIERSPDGSAVVNARIPVKDFNEKFDTDIPEDEEYETISGFLHKITGRIPDLNDEITSGNLVFTIVKKTQRRIRQVKVRKSPAANARQ